jgi:hypothetical protein
MDDDSAVRTVADEVADAIKALDAATREAERWREHLLRVPAESDDAPGIMLQARRSAQIVSALVTAAESHTRASAALQELRVRSVS